MKLDWRFHEYNEFEYTRPPSVWIAVAITVLVCVAGFVLTVLTWEKGQPVVSAPFLIRALLAPLAVSGFACGLLYADHEDTTEDVDIWNFLRARGRVRWQAWSQGCVAILESVTFTPEKDLAERMLGLEGSEPRNEGKMLPLRADTQTDALERGEGVVLSGERLEGVLEKIVMPFVPYMERFAAGHTFSIILQSEDETAIDALRALVRKLNVPGAGRIEIERAEAPLDMGLVHRWLNDVKMPDFCLALACQLHQDGQEARYSEATVGMLLAPEHVISQYGDKLKVQAYLFQPVSAAADSVTPALRGMLKAQRLPPEYVQHVWLGGLPKQARHAAKAAAGGAGLAAAVHDVDLAIGVAGPASALLAQALAAEMVQHGQGTQLVATSGGAGILLNLAGTQAVPVPAEPTFELRSLRPVRIVGFACMGALLGFTLYLTKAPGGVYVLVPGFVGVATLVDALCAQGRYNWAENVFYGRDS